MSYVDHAFYEDLVGSYTGWDAEARCVSDEAVVAGCTRLLLREARLLDQQKYGDWLALYAQQCAYWVPATPQRGDPRREVAICFDDRRRLEDRIYRLGTGYAWSQAPASRTVRVVSNVEVFSLPGGKLMTRSNFLLSEFRAGETRLWSGWCAHRLPGPGGPIEVKQVNLVDCDQNLRNPSLIL